jgi:hypothetical protein
VNIREFKPTEREGVGSMLLSNRDNSGGNPLQCSFSSETFKSVVDIVKTIDDMMYVIDTLSDYMVALLRDYEAGRLLYIGEPGIEYNSIEFCTASIKHVLDKEDTMLSTVLYGVMERVRAAKIMEERERTTAYYYHPEKVATIIYSYLRNTLDYCYAEGEREPKSYIIQNGGIASSSYGVGTLAYFSAALTRIDIVVKSMQREQIDENSSLAIGLQQLRKELDAAKGRINEEI